MGGDINVDESDMEGDGGVGVGVVDESDMEGVVDESDMEGVVGESDMEGDSNVGVGSNVGVDDVDESVNVGNVDVDVVVVDDDDDDDDVINERCEDEGE